MRAGIMELTGHCYESKDGWRFTFQATHVCPYTGTMIAQQSFVAKKAYPTEEEAEEALKRSCKHYGDKVLATVKAVQVEALEDNGDIKIQLEVDPFARTGPEVH